MHVVAPFPQHWVAYHYIRMEPLMASTHNVTLTWQNLHTIIETASIQSTNPTTKAYVKACHRMACGVCFMLRRLINGSELGISPLPSFWPRQQVTWWWIFIEVDTKIIDHIEEVVFTVRIKRPQNERPTSMMNTKFSFVGHNIDPHHGNHLELSWALQIWNISFTFELCYVSDNVILFHH